MEVWKSISLLQHLLNSANFLKIVLLCYIAEKEWWTQDKTKLLMAVFFCCCVMYLFRSNIRQEEGPSHFFRKNSLMHCHNVCGQIDSNLSPVKWKWSPLIVLERRSTAPGSFLLSGIIWPQFRKHAFAQSCKLSFWSSLSSRQWIMSFHPFTDGYSFSLSIDTLHKREYTLRGFLFVSTYCWAHACFEEWQFSLLAGNKVSSTFKWPFLLHE